MAMRIMCSVSSALLSSSPSVSSAASTPPHSTPPASQAAPFCATVVPSSATAPIDTHGGPALRVLEWNNGPKKSKGTKAKIRNDEDSTDIIDNRGYVDGVKVARKRRKKPKVEVPSPPPSTSVPTGPPVVPERRRREDPILCQHIPVVDSSFHLLVSVLVFISILWPWVGKIKGPFNFDFGPFCAAKEVRGQTVTRTASLLAALAQGEAKRLTKALGWGSHLRKKVSNSERGSDLKRFVSSTQHGRLEHSVVPCHAARIWEVAKHDGGIACAYERLILSSVGVESRLKAAGIKAKWDRYTPIGIVACTLVLELTESVVPASLESE
ncbi:hypothetical protein ARMSODRAFT_1003371 [Armillaria solidipes]|uniref:Uncharacterized protein n=1 Tax=Armillaria solidipes TaxID=1076256 RepID=A0A2H3BIX5_9AGAR|nr:hypothetical protein ARMSODRAFT_1003371 [Armillaria solidipes]